MSHNDNLLHSLTSAAVTKWQDPVTGQHPESPEGNLHPNTHMHPHTDAFMLSVVRANSRMLTHRSLTSHGHVTHYYTRLSQTCAHSRSNADEQEETLHFFFFFSLLVHFASMSIWYDQLVGHELLLFPGSSVKSFELDFWVNTRVNTCLCVQDCWTALISAAKEGHIQVVRELLENNANLEHRDMVRTERNSDITHEERKGI